MLARAAVMLRPGGACTFTLAVAPEAVAAPQDVWEMESWGDAEWSAPCKEVLEPLLRCWPCWLLDGVPDCMRSAFALATLACREWPE